MVEFAKLGTVRSRSIIQSGPISNKIGVFLHVVTVIRPLLKRSVLRYKITVRLSISNVVSNNSSILDDHMFGGKGVCDTFANNFSRLNVHVFFYVVCLLKPQRMSKYIRQYTGGGGAMGISGHLLAQISYWSQTHDQSCTWRKTWILVLLDFWKGLVELPAYRSRTP